MSNNVEALNRLFRAAGEKFPKVEGVPPYDPDKAAELINQIDELVKAHGELVKAHGEPGVIAPSEQEVLDMLRNKRRFIERFGAGYAPEPLPLTVRLSYDDFAHRDFKAGSAHEFVFSLFDSCQELLDEFEITEEPRSIVISVYRSSWHQTIRRGPGRAENRIHPIPKGEWIKMLDLKVQENTPFFNFEELELAHVELWMQLQEYARRSINPCQEIPLVEQRCGTFFPKQ